MKFCEAWLREWIDPAMSTEELVEQLTMAGLEVDGHEPSTTAFSGVVVGLVLTKEQHPDADKLSLCQVDVGNGDTRQIICGAKNVAAGMKVPAAVIGAKLPDNFKIKRAKLRGIESLGMICSASELGLSDNSEGILSLPDNAPVGMDFRDYLSLDDQVIDVDLTPDRADCLSILGVAREVGVFSKMKVTQPIAKTAELHHQDKLQVRLEAHVACPRYTCRIIKGIDPKATTPMWMQERLRRAGLRAISPVVDITNYVLLELGQPMHSFDLATLSGDITVRMAKPNEALILLDGQGIKLRDDTLVIADADKALAMAGIMGGSASSVTDTTQDILLESAFFNPLAITGKSRTYGLHTDSSHRFERGVDPQLQVRALERATGLLLDIVGGQVGPITEAFSVEDLKTSERPEILLRAARIKRLLGIDVSDEDVVEYLTRLDMQVATTDTGWLVTAPSCRFDINIEADLIEEIGRIYGYTEIPIHHGAATTLLKATKETDFNLMTAKQLLVARDYQEVITYSFISPELQKTLDAKHQTVVLANPISTDMSVMRTSLWPGLIQTAVHNQARQQPRVRIFESGLRFIKEDGDIRQEPMLAGLICGNEQADQWGAISRQVDFYDLKADLEAVLSLTGCADVFRFEIGTLDSLHPGQSAEIKLADKSVGWIGLLHPELQAKLNLAGNSFLFEISLNELQPGRLPSFKPLSKFPVIKRDLALVLKESISFAEVKSVISTIAPEILQDILVFDVYNGEKVGSGLRSLALSLILQGISDNLTDQDIELVVTQILETLEKELNAQLRD